MQACGAQQHMTGSLRTVGCVAGGLTSLPTTQGRSQECFARPQILREECGTMQVPPERDDDSTGHSTQRQPGQHDPYYGEFRGQPRGPQVLGYAWESMRKGPQPQPQAAGTAEKRHPPALQASSGTSHAGGAQTDMQANHLRHKSLEKHIYVYI